jgi:hypothetical protein
MRELLEGAGLRHTEGIYDIWDDVCFLESVE